MMMSLNERKLQIFLFLFSLIIYAYFISSFHSANESSRFALTRAIIDERTFIIDKYREYASIDVTYYNGHYYSDKIPGTSLLAIPVYLLDLSLGFKEDYQFFNSLALLTTIFSALSVILVYKISRSFNFSNMTCFVLSLIYGFGTVAWVFSKTFFAHPYSAFFALLSVYFILLYFKKKTKSDLKRYSILFGISLGLFVMMEYTNFIIAALLLFLFFLKSKNKLQNLLQALVPFSIFVLVVLGYNYAIFGNPFTIPLNYHYSFGNTLQTQWFRLSKLSEGFYGLTVGFSAGLLFMSPIILLSILGFIIFLKKDKLMAKIFALCFLVTFFFYAASESWHGGNAYGPRYLQVAVPFLIFPIGFLMEKYKKNKIFWLISIPLIVYSIILNGAGALNDPTPAETIKNPFFEHNMPNLLRGELDSYFYRQNKTSLIFFMLSLIVLTSFLVYFYRSKIISLKFFKHS